MYRVSVTDVVKQRRNEKRLQYGEEMVTTVRRASQNQFTSSLAVINLLSHRKQRHIMRKRVYCPDINFISCGCVLRYWLYADIYVQSD